RTARRRRSGVGGAVARDARRLRAAHCRVGEAVHWHAMTAQQAKQVVKNALYRTIGEASTTLRLMPNGRSTLRVLMYHKVNDIPDNPTTIPVSLFDEQLAQLRELGYETVDLDAVLDHYALGKQLPDRAVLITFDDGYRDTLENALPVLQKHGY